MNRVPAGLREGVEASLPLLVGIVPFALIAGVAAVNAGLSAPAAVGMSVIVFAGAAQLAIIELLGENAPLAVVVLTGVVINLRMLMYSASIAPYFRGHGTRWKAVLAYFLTDQAYALSISRYEANADETGERDTAEADGTDTDGGRSTAGSDGGEQPLAGMLSMDLAERRWYYLGVGVTLWAVWNVGTVVGVALGRGLPPSWGLDFAVPLVFLALAVPRLEDRPTTAAGIVAAVVAVLAVGVPFDLGLPLAAVVGLVVGLVVEEVTAR